MFKEFTQIKNEIPTNLVDADILAMWAMSELIEKQKTHRLVLDVKLFLGWQDEDTYKIELCDTLGEPMPEGVKAVIHRTQRSTATYDSETYASILDATKELAQLLKGQWYDLHIERF